MGSNNYLSDLSTDEKLLMTIVKAAETFKRVVSAIFRNYGLSFPQYNVLRVLDSSKDGQNKISDVSRIMLVPDANMTGIAKRLEKSGFIIRKAHPSDERVTLLEITPKGRQTVRNIEKERQECDKATLEGLSEEQRSQLLVTVRQIVKNGLKIASGPGA
jgi:DNA-binding MarR family transcriptional regulator